jgi:hypothetical protein
LSFLDWPRRDVSRGLLNGDLGAHFGERAVPLVHREHTLAHERSMERVLLECQGLTAVVERVDLEPREIRAGV